MWASLLLKIQNYGKRIGTLMDKLNKYLDYAIERALKTVAQVAIASIGATAVGVLDVDWVQVLSVSALAGVMSLLTSVLSYDKAPE
jgi:mannose/cellobiose epimerase-like protein (N-acyl-D-glucosamine 2-epimerase family)